jgi:hypothetical protein
MCINKTTRNVTSLMLVSQDYKNTIGMRGKRTIQMENHPSSYLQTLRLTFTLTLDRIHVKSTMHKISIKHERTEKDSAEVSNHWHGYQNWHVGKLANMQNCLNH